MPIEQTSSLMDGRNSLERDSNEMSDSPNSGIREFSAGKLAEPHRTRLHVDNGVVYEREDRFPDPKNAQPSSLSYDLRSVVLILFFVPLVVTAWILTCVMAVRPVHYPSYINQTAGYYPETVRGWEKWWTAVRVLNSIISVLTVPIVSVLLAHGSIVYSQRCRASQKLKLSQMLALADRGWSDPWLLFSSRSAFLLIGCFVLVLNAIQQPIQSILISSETITIVSTADIPTFYTNLYGGDTTASYIPDFPQDLLGWDPEPANLATIPLALVVEDVLKKTPMVTNKDIQPYLWPISSAAAPPSGYVSPNNLNSSMFYFNQYPEGYFISAFQNGTTTGVLREHAMRLNTSLDCGAISSADFPETCTGDSPFEASYHFHGRDNNTSDLKVRACAPGNHSKSPWTLSRDRQDIEEETFLDVKTAGLFVDAYIPSFTMKCRSSTTRGYFELGNYHNDYHPGGLIEKWPTSEEMNTEFNDYLIGLSNDVGIWSEPPLAVGNRKGEPVDWTLPLAYLNDMNAEDTATPGPLTTSFIALFGKRSLFHTISESVSNSTSGDTSDILQPICQQGSIPFGRYCGTKSSASLLDCSQFTSMNVLCNQTKWQTELPNLISQVLKVYDPTWSQPLPKESLLTATYFAIESYLLQTQSASAAFSDEQNAPTARPLFSSSGTTLTKPVMSTNGKLGMSILLGLQLLSLICLTIYIYSVPTWSASFNAYALLRMGSSLGNLPALGPVEEKEIERLKEEDGLVGVIENFEGNKMTVFPRLELGAPGMANRSAWLRSIRGDAGLLEDHSESTV